MAAAGHIRAVMSELQRLESPYRRIMIVGGGNIGAGLARQLEKRYSVKLIERNQKRAEQLSNTWKHHRLLRRCGGSGAAGGGAHRPDRRLHRGDQRG